jgi:hypothetical protein
MALSNDFNMAYDQFVSAWLDYERVRSTGDFAERVASKQRVDDLRLRVRAFVTGHAA